MPRIDAHVHLYSPDINGDPAAWAAAQGERHWAALCTRRRRDGRPVQSFPSPGDLLRAMDAAGVERAVLLGWYWERFDSCVTQNRFLAATVCARPDRLAGCATLHPAAGRAAALDEVRRAQGEGLIGLGELSPHSQGYRVDDPVFLEVLDLAGQLRLPVNLHVTDPAGRDYPGRIETPGGDFLGLARSFPGTTFVLAHWGGLLPLRNPVALELSNLLYDTAASPLLYDAGVWQRFCAVVPSERVLFGSDFPLNLYPRLDDQPSLERLVAEALAAGMGGAVMGGNAARLLNWQGES